MLAEMSKESCKSRYKKTNTLLSSWHWVIESMSVPHIELHRICKDWRLCSTGPWRHLCVCVEGQGMSCSDNPITTSQFPAPDIRRPESMTFYITISIMLQLFLIKLKKKRFGGLIWEFMNMLSKLQALTWRQTCQYNYFVKCGSVCSGLKYCGIFIHVVESKSMWLNSVKTHKRWLGLGRTPVKVSWLLRAEYFRLLS